MKCYIFYTVLFLFHTQVYSIEWLSKKYQDFSLKRADTHGDFSKMQKIFNTDFQPKKVLQMLSCINNRDEAQQEMYNLCRRLIIVAACEEGNLENFLTFSLDSNFDLWTGALALCNLPLLSDTQAVMFERCIQFLSVQQRSELFKQLVTGGQLPDIRDDRIAILMNAGVVPHIKGISKRWGRVVGKEIAVLWGTLPHDFPLQYALYYDDQNLQTREEQGRRLAPSTLTLLHFARSCNGGRSEHLRRCSREMPNKNGGVTTKYCVPSLRSLAFDAFARALSSEQVAELNRCAVAKRT